MINRETRRPLTFTASFACGRFEDSAGTRRRKVRVLVGVLSKVSGYWQAQSRICVNMRLIDNACALRGAGDVPNQSAMVRRNLASNFSRGISGVYCGASRCCWGKTRRW
ncbi:hypothetical protein KCP74_02200 [Salmonella enterica subsp. enterica]|nr:hypothetical protein KCP74_02200 [Salmonella enterica subsp. enterica]